MRDIGHLEPRNVIDPASAVVAATSASADTRETP